jgi:hypothetical protein
MPRNRVRLSVPVSRFVWMLGGLACCLALALIGSTWLLGKADAASQAPIAAYSLDAGTGAVAEDITGSEHEGTITTGQDAEFPGLQNVSGRFASAGSLLTSSKAAVLPEARTTEAFGVHAFEAVMAGLVDPRGLPTRFRFQYGRTHRYGTITEASEEVVDGNRKVEVAEGLRNLLPKTTYHYRIIAFNRNGSVHGQDRTFTTKRPRASESR